MMIALYIVLGLILLVLALVYLGLPLLFMLLAKIEVKIDGTIQEEDPAELPEEDLAYMDTVEKALTPEGFVKIGYASSEDVMDESFEHYLVMIHEPSGTIVTADVTYESEEDTKPSERSVIFDTFYDNGLTIETSNEDYVTTPDIPRKELNVKMPAIRDPGILWRYHEARTKDENKGGSLVPVDPGLSAVDHYTRLMRSGMDGRAKTLCWKKTSQGTYKISILGYFLTAWTQVPPLSRVMLSRRMSAEQKVKDRYPHVTKQLDAIADAKREAAYSSLSG